MNAMVWFQHPYLLILARCLLATVFLTSAVGKLRDRHAFTTIVLDYQVLPRHWAPRFAHVLPWIELLVGVMLLVSLGVQVAAVASLTLLLSFIVAVGINLFRGRKDLNCGCTGARHGHKISGWILLRNAGLILLALPIVLWGRDDPFVMGWLVEGLALTLRHIVFVDRGLPFVLVICGTLMVMLLFRQLQHLARKEME